MTTLSAPQRFRVALLALFVAALIAPASIFAQSTAAPAKKGPRGKLTFTPKSLPFGKVPVGTTSQTSVTLTNVGAVAIEITRITATGPGFSTVRDCLGPLAAGDACQVVVTFAPAAAKSARGTKVTGTLEIEDNASASPHKVALSAVKFRPADGGAPTPVPTPTPTPGAGSTPLPTPTPAPGSTPLPTPTATSGTPFAIQAAGIYVFDTVNNGQGVAPTLQIVQYTTDLATGATSQSGLVTAGTGLNALTFTANGQYAYGLDSAGNVWGYSVSPTGMLTSEGSLPAPPAGVAASNWLRIYGNSMLWTADSSGMNNSVTPITVVQYAINSNGTLASPTTVTLTGGNLEPFTPPGSNLPTAIWAFWNNDSAGIFLSTLNVYPVNSDGTINGTSIQNMTVPDPLVEATTGAFAYGVGQPNPQPLPAVPPTPPVPEPLPPQTLYTFSLGSDGTLTPNPTVALPQTPNFWGAANPLAPGIGSTLDLTDDWSLVVYPVSSAGVVGTILQNITLGGLPQFPLGSTFNASSGPPAFSNLPTLWVEDGSPIDEFTINPDGTIGPYLGSVSDGTNGSQSGVSLGGQGEALEPAPQNPLSYGVNNTTDLVYGYDVSPAGILASLGSFAPAVPPGQYMVPPACPFPPLAYSASPVALFVYNSGGEVLGGSILVYPLAFNGMPAEDAQPLDTISTPGLARGLPTESFLILMNGQVQVNPFGGGVNPDSPGNPGS
jgi:hypothetical protein